MAADLQRAGLKGHTCTHVMALMQGWHSADACGVSAGALLDEAYMGVTPAHTAEAQHGTHDSAKLYLSHSLL
jgi:hypothetical protein